MPYRSVTALGATLCASLVLLSGCRGSESAAAEALAPHLSQPLVADYVLNNLEHTLLHEFGHALVHQFELPVLGQEEDAVDAFATLEMLRGYETEDVGGMLADVVDALLVAAEEAGTLGSEMGLEFFGEHDLDQQRAYRIVCFAAGSYPDLLSDLATEHALSEDQQDTCIDEANNAWFGWDSLLEPAYQSDHDGSAVALVWDRTDEALSEYHDELAWLDSTELLKTTADYMEETFAWPEPVTLSITLCEEANAFYDPQTVTVELCAELVRDYLRLAVRQRAN